MSNQTKRIVQKLILISSFLVLIAVGCTKKSKAIKTLEGEWKVISYIESEDGTPEEFISPGGYGLTLVFEKCPVFGGEFCPLEWIQYFPSEGFFSTNLEYRLLDKGTVMETRNPQDIENTTVQFDMIGLTETDLVLEVVDGTGPATLMILEKK